MMDYLAHYGIKRKSGRYAYGSGKRPNQHDEKVFISGSSKTQFKDSGYYRKSLDKRLKSEIDSYIDNGNKILIGEAPGIDRQAQNYLKKKGYKNVVVYTTGDKPRYLADKSWKIKKVDPKDYEPGTPEFLRQKDIAMTNDANKGLAVVLENGGAGATRNNVQRLINQNKDVKVFQLASTGDSFIDDLSEQFDMSLKVKDL